MKTSTWYIDNETDAVTTEAVLARIEAGEILLYAMLRREGEAQALPLVAPQAAAANAAIRRREES